jgi:hypothetical protein
MRDLMDPLDPRQMARENLVAGLRERCESVQERICKGLKAMGLYDEIRRLERGMMGAEEDLAGARVLPPEWTAWKETLDLFCRLWDVVAKSCSTP